MFGFSSPGQKKQPRIGPDDAVFTVRGQQYLVRDVSIVSSNARSKITKLVGSHLQTLARRRIALIRVDAYGVVDAKDWIAEVQHFADKVILPALDHLETIVVSQSLNDLMQELVEEPARRECARIEASYTFDDTMSAVQYERFCASRLESIGWTCELTKGSGDQGADVIGRKDGRVIIVQCKKYSSPVGNAAVQEVYAAKGHLRADWAAVVTNAGFTRSAVELGNSTGVLLIHHAEIDGIEGLLSGLS